MSSVDITENKASKLKSVGHKIAIGILFLIALRFLYTMHKYAFNAPLAPDDIKMYVQHFMERYLDAGTLGEKIKYFFSQTNYPHAKMSGRTFSAIYYELFGTVNFKFLIMLGSVVLAAFVFSAKYITRLDFVLILPLALLLLLPDRMNFWVGPITGYPFLLLYALLVYYGLSKGRFIVPAIIAFIASFTHTPGMAIFVAAAPMFFVAPNNVPWKRLLWLVLFLVTVFVYWKLILSNGSVVRGGEQRGLSDIVQCIPSMIVYEGQFLSMPFSGTNSFGKYIKTVPVVGAIFALFILFLLLAIVYIRRKTFDARSAMMLCFVFFCMIPGPIAAFSNDTCASFSDSVAPRYLMYSMMAWTGIYLFLLTALKKEYRIWVAVIFLAAFMPRYFYVYKNLEKQDTHRNYLWAKRATLNSPLANRRPEGFGYFRDAIDRGVYNPYLPEFSLSESPVPDDDSQLTEFWYDYRKNKYFCKFEAVFDLKDDPLVEVWVEKSGNVERRIPMQTSARSVKSSFKVLVENPDLIHLTGRTKSYFYAAPIALCGDIKFRVNNKVSESITAEFIPSR